MPTFRTSPAALAGAAAWSYPDFPGTLGYSIAYADGPHSCGFVQHDATRFDSPTCPKHLIGDILSDHNLLFEDGRLDAIPERSDGLDWQAH